MILTRIQGSALFFYATNYATKLHTPMYQRIASAAEVYQRMIGEEASRDEREGSSRVEGGNPQTKNKARQFLMRVANRVFTDRELSAVDVTCKSRRGIAGGITGEQSNKCRGQECH